MFEALKNHPNPKMRDKKPQCEQCHPGVSPENLEAWNIFQRYSNPWGMDSVDVLTLCEKYGVEDPLECSEKVVYLIEEISERTNKK
jgi:hypothetical protein